MMVEPTQVSFFVLPVVTCRVFVALELWQRAQNKNKVCINGVKPTTVVVLCAISGNLSFCLSPLNYGEEQKNESIGS